VRRQLFKSDKLKYVGVRRLHCFQRGTRKASRSPSFRPGKFHDPRGETLLGRSSAGWLVAWLSFVCHLMAFNPESLERLPRRTGVGFGGTQAPSNRLEIALDLRRPDSFDVSRPRQIEVTPGDKMLIRASDKRLGLTNGQVLTVSRIAPDGALQTKEGLCVPTDFGNGVTVPSLPRTRWTGDHVVVAADASRQKGPTWRALEVANPASYPPDKARLIESLPEGNRRAAQVIEPSTARMRIAPPQKRLSQSI